MNVAIRLLTVVDVDDRPDAIDVPVIDGPTPDGFQPGLAPLSDGPSLNDACSMSLSALHMAVLEDGRQLTLLDDRGWAVSGPPDIWCRTSIAEVEETARTVVGPDEPISNYTQADMASDHWAYLAGNLRQQNVPIGADELSRLPHDIALTDRLRTRLTDT